MRARVEMAVIESPAVVSFLEPNLSESLPATGAATMKPTLLGSM